MFFHAHASPFVLHGRVEPKGWAFWSEGGTIDDEAEGDWREWTTNNTHHLDKLLPRDWLMFFPETIHPLFIVWFQDRYNEAIKQLPPEIQDVKMNWAGKRWHQVFARKIKQ